MDIVIVGSGNMATVLGRKILSAGHNIIQVYSRNPVHAAVLATLLKAKPISTPAEIEKNSDLSILAIADNAYPEFVAAFPSSVSFIVHTAGSVPMDILKNISPRYGVLYPLQSLRKELKTLPEFPILFDANTPGNLEELKKFAAGLSSTIIQANDEARLKYHLAAVLTANFSNHLFALTEVYCRQEKIEFPVLQPLLEETVLRMRNTSPAVVQTGPAIRNDTLTLEKHRQLLKAYPALADWYEGFTRSIWEFYAK